MLDSNQHCGIMTAMRSDEFALDNLTGIAAILQHDVKNSSTAILVRPVEGGYHFEALFPIGDEPIVTPAGIDFYYLLMAKFSDAPRGSCMVVFDFQQTIGTVFAHIVSCTHTIHGFSAQMHGGVVGNFHPDERSEMGEMLADNLNALAAGLN